jgi:gentisate 1,2-dioxygenase
LRVAAKTVPIEECERRALVFANPGLDGKPYITNTLFAAYSLYNPGERAPVHRHTPSASRFVLEGDGGFTVVEGEKLRMSRGDLILTPTGTWHDHGNDGREAVIWVDVLNVPLVESLNATRFEFDYTERDAQSNTGEPIPKTLQTVREPDDHSQRLYGTGGIKPLFVSHRRGPTEHSPMFVYRWENTRAALEKLSSYEGSPYDGIIFEYVDPTTGGCVMPTMSFRCQMLRRCEHTLAHRKTASHVYCVLARRRGIHRGRRRPPGVEAQRRLHHPGLALARTQEHRRKRRLLLHGDRRADDAQARLVPRRGARQGRQDSVAMTSPISRSFLLSAPAARVVLGSGGVGQLANELDRLEVKRALFACTSNGRSRYAPIIEGLGARCVEVFAGAEPHYPEPVAEAAAAEVMIADLGSALIERDGEIGILHLPGQGFTEGLAEARRAVYVPFVAGHKKRSEEWNALGAPRTIPDFCDFCVS